MNYYKRHLGDYAKNTRTLTTYEHGVYNLVLDLYYTDESPVTTEDAYLICRAEGPKDRAMVDRVLSKFFVRDGDTWRNERADEEIEKYREKSAKNKAIGSLGGQQKAKRMASETLGETLEECLANGNPSHEPLATKEQKIDSPDGEPSAGKPANPPCPQQAIIALYHETLPELRQVREWNDTRQKLLAKRWRESPDRQSLEWWGKYFAYVRKSRFLMGQTTGRDGRPFDCDLEWLVRPTNFAKVIEGKYEDAR